MFIRESLNLSLLDLSQSTRDRVGDVVRVTPDQVVFALDAETPVITMGEHEILWTDDIRDQMASLLGVPSAFSKRLEKTTKRSTRNLLMDELFKSNVGGELAVSMVERTSDGVKGVSAINEWGKTPVQPHQLVDIARRVTGSDDAEVVRLVDTPSQFGFDTVVPQSHALGKLGDPKLNDVTSGGLRWSLDIKHGLVPSVEPYMYRLVCTNGMSAADHGLKVDARGQTVEEVLAEIESMAQIAFGRVESTVEHFYSLREERVTNPERAIRAISRERGLPDRSTMALIDLAAGEDLPDEPTMFDIVNLVTNLANSPNVTRDGARTSLERAGGEVVNDHASRCGHCSQKVH